MTKERNVVFTTLMHDTKPRLDVPAWPAAAQPILEQRYLGAGETVVDMCWRVACKVASAEVAYIKASQDADTLAEVRRVRDRFYAMMLGRTFLPNTPTLVNAGRNDDQQLSACYVLPLEDSMLGIMDTLRTCALVHKAAGGTGMSFSRLRPKGSPVNGSGGYASGPVGFLRMFDAVTEEIKQGGVRANLGGR